MTAKGNAGIDIEFLLNADSVGPFDHLFGAHSLKEVDGGEIHAQHHGSSKADFVGVATVIIGGFPADPRGEIMADDGGIAQLGRHGDGFDGSTPSNAASARGQRKI